MLTIENKTGKKLTLFLAVVTLFAGCGPPGPRALFKGKKLLEQGKYPEAVEKLEMASKLLNTNAQVWNYLGLAHHQAGQPDLAVKAYQHALALDHDLTEAHYNLGCLWLGQNKFDAARTEFTAYTLRRENSAEGFLKLGAAQLRLRELVAAEKSFNDALRLNQQNPEALTGLGLVRVQRLRFDDAVQCFNKALKQQPDYAPALLNLAIVEQEHLKDPQAALQKYREYLALKQAPEHAESVRAIVHDLEQELNVPPRPAVSNLAAQPNPNSVVPKPAVPELVRVASPAKNPGTNIARVASAPKPEPATTPAKPLPATNALKPEPTATLPPAITPLPSANVEVVKLPAEPVLKSAEDDPATSVQAQGSAATLVVRATSVPSSGTSSTGAKRTFLQPTNPFSRLDSEPTGSAPTVPLSQAGIAEADLSGLAPGTTARYTYKYPAKPRVGNRADAERSFAQGVQAQQAQRLPEAIEAYRRATQLDPSYFDAYYNLALAASATGNLPIALVSYEEALSVRPDSLDARYNFALVLKQANYPIDAAKELEKLLLTYPNDSRTHLALGNLEAQQLHQPAKARDHYLKVLETDPRNPQAAAIRYWLTESSR